MELIDPTGENLVYRMEHWGYYLLPQSHPHCPGYTGLLVAMRKTPTEKHFDPESMRIQLVNPSGMPDWTVLNLQTPLSKSRRVYPGSLNLCDRLNQEETFFTFGGTLESLAVTGETIYSLRSAAPILWLTSNGDGLADQLAAEFGHMLGELHARFGAKDEAFYRRVAKLDPLMLYIASLHSIFDEYEKTASLRGSYPKLHTLLHEEQKWLEESDQWSHSPETLAELLQPGQGGEGAGKI